MAKKAKHVPTARDIRETLPLTVDPTTGGLRFAAPGDGEPSVRDPHDLPDVHAEIVAFRDATHAQAWCAAAAEFGGNALSISFPAISHPRVALIIRADRERLPGQTLEEVVPLRFPLGSGSRSELNSDVEHGTRIAADRSAQDRRQAAILGEWSDVVKAAGALPDVSVAVDSDGWQMRASVRHPNGFLGVLPEWTLQRDRGRVLATSRRKENLGLPSLLAGSVAERLDELGLAVSLPDGVISYDLQTAGAEAIEAFGRAVREAEAALEQADKKARKMHRIEALRSERRLMQAVEAMGRGYPLAHDSGSFSAYQLMPQRGGDLRVIEVQPYLRRELQQYGLATTIYEHEGKALYAATTFGLAVLAGEIDQALRSENLVEGEPLDDLADVLPVDGADEPSDELREAVGAAVDGASIRSWDARSLAFVGAGLLTGCLELRRQPQPS